MPEIERDQGNTEERLQAAMAEEGNKAAGVHANVGRTILGTWRAILGRPILGTPEIEQDLDCADSNGKAVTQTEGCATLGTSILGATQAPEIARAPEIAQMRTSKAQFNTEQLDRSDAEREEAAQALRVAKEAERLEEQEEEAKRQRWDR